MLKINDIMTRDVFTLSPQTSADEAAWALAVRGISGAPVRDAMGRLLGVLSRSDLTDPEREPWGPGGKTVRDLMTPALLTLRGTDPVMQAVRLMVREEIHRVVVLDEYGHLAGILTSTDILKALVEGMPINDSAEARNDDPYRDQEASWETAVTVH
jgi:CBS-domain-containing membrane protein